MPDLPNPFAVLASAAGKVVADGWTAAMLGIWQAGLWLLRLVLGLVDSFTTPDLTEGGPGAGLYRTTFWVAVTLMIILVMVQLGIAAFRRDGRSLARVLVGVGQFVVVWAAWISYAVAVLAACSGLTEALMNALLGVDAWSAWQPWEDFSTQDVTDATVATVLGLLGVFLVFAAVGHLLVMLTRAGALMVLAATTPICAAGLVSDFGRVWFWRSLRWFHAAAFTPVIMVMVAGVGVQLTSGVATGMADGVQRSVGTAVPGIILICISTVSPLALFKLLAFVDPGTSSGAAMRTGLIAQGGISGLLGRGAASGGATSRAASTTDEQGRSQAETAGEDATTSRFAQGARELLGAAGQVAGTALGAVTALGQQAAVIGADQVNMSGVGHNNPVADAAPGRAGRRRVGRVGGTGTGATSVDDEGGGGGDGGLGGSGFDDGVDGLDDGFDTFDGDQDIQITGDPDGDPDIQGVPDVVPPRPARPARPSRTPPRTAPRSPPGPGAPTTGTGSRGTGSGGSGSGGAAGAKAAEAASAVPVIPA